MARAWLFFNQNCVVFRQNTSDLSQVSVLGGHGPWFWLSVFHWITTPSMDAMDTKPCHHGFVSIAYTTLQILAIFTIGGAQRDAQPNKNKTMFLCLWARSSKLDIIWAIHLEWTESNIERGGTSHSKNSQNPGIAKIDLTPAPQSWHSGGFDEKAQKCNSQHFDVLTRDKTAPAVKIAQYIMSRLRCVWQTISTSAADW